MEDGVVSNVDPEIPNDPFGDEHGNAKDGMMRLPLPDLLPDDFVELACSFALDVTTSYQEPTGMLERAEIAQEQSEGR